MKELDYLGIAQKISNIDKIWNLLDKRPHDEPISQDGWLHELKDSSSILYGFWINELYNKLELIDSKKAKVNALKDDDPITADSPIDNSSDRTWGERTASRITKQVSKYTDDNHHLYCDVSLNEVLENKEIISRLGDYRDDLIDNDYFNISVSSSEDNLEQINQIKSNLGNKFNEYLTKNGIIFAQDILPVLRDKLDNEVINSDVYDINTERIKRLVLSIHSIEHNQVVLVYKSNYKCVPILEILVDLNQNFLN